MKMHWAVLKKPRILIAVVIVFVVVWYLASRHSSGSGSSSGTVSAPGVDPNQLAAAAQIQIAQIQAGGAVAQINAAGNVQVALAQIAAGSHAQDTTVAAAIASQTLAVQQSTANAQIAFDAHQADLQYQAHVSDNNFALGYAAQTYGYSLQSQAINANVQETLSQDQLKAYEFTGLNNDIQQFGNPARREALIPQLMNFAGGAPVTTPTIQPTGGGGGINPLHIISPITAIL